MIYIFYIPRIFKKKKKNDIPRIFLEHECISCGVNVMFYDAVNMIHDVFSTANLFPYTAEFTFDGVRKNKTQQTRR